MAGKAGGKKRTGGEKQRHDNKKKNKGKRKKEKERTITAEECVMKWAKVECLTPGSFDLHTHSTCSDGLLSPDLLVAKAYRNGVRVLALTDHDTMAGVPAALEAARRHGIRIIPGIEISAKNMTRSHDRGGIVSEEPVHILAYYGSCGPSNPAQLQDRLTHVQEGRYQRAQEMVDKLCLLHKPITLEQVLRIAGKGVAPARPHVARALVEAGHVESVGVAFSKYLHNDGPAYAKGTEIPAEEVVNLIRLTGGISVLAHPWSLKDPMPLIKRLKLAGLHGMEVYRSDGKSSAFGPVAEMWKLVKLGGSDFHATGASDETDLGGVALPPLVLHEFLKLAEPIWSSALETLLQNFASDALGRTPKNFGNHYAGKGDICVKDEELLEGKQANEVSLTLSPWLSEEERNAAAVVASGLGLMHTVSYIGSAKVLVVSRQAC